jgi:hypothetical protein
MEHEMKCHMMVTQFYMTGYEMRCVYFMCEKYKMSRKYFLTETYVRSSSQFISRTQKLTEQNLMRDT